VLGLAALLFLPETAAGAERGPSTPKERQKALRLIHQLEADPLGAKAHDARRWLALWLLDVPDFQVRYCPEVIGGDRSARQRIRPDLLAQIPWSGAAFLIENPKKGDARTEIYTAGLLGALRAYEALLKARPDQRSPLLDQLLVKREAGELEKYVAETSQVCPWESTDQRKVSARRSSAVRDRP
jgi:hypothetical protein